MAQKRQMVGKTPATRDRDATRTWWYPVEIYPGQSPMHVHIYERPVGYFGEKEYAWTVDCPRCGLREGSGTATSAGRAETAATRWARAHAAGTHGA